MLCSMYRKAITLLYIYYKQRDSNQEKRNLYTMYKTSKMTYVCPKNPKQTNPHASQEPMLCVMTAVLFIVLTMDNGNLNKISIIFLNN